MDDPFKTNENEGPVREYGLLTTPLSLRGVPSWLIYVLAFISFIYILNPTLGVFELIPDNLPIIGNLDEGLAFLLLWTGIVEVFEGKKAREGQTMK